MLCQYALLGFVAAAVASPLTTRQTETTNETTPKTFKDIPWTKDLEWTPCEGNFTCVNLEVPLDYEDPDVGTTNVAFVRWETPNQPAKGDILVNPGGPGGSAVAMILGRNRENLLKTLGTSYNLVGMDPRGVNNSGPSLECFPGRPAARLNHELIKRWGWDSKSETSLRNTWETSKAFGQYCASTLNETTTNYANTPAVVQDMLHYIKLRAKQNGEPEEDAKLNFYGVSYGSILASTFAAMHPDRVGRIIADGVMNVDEYYKGDWTTTVVQADAAVAGFSKECYEAGLKCVFFQNDTSADDIQQRIDKVLENLEKSPLPVGDPTSVAYPTVITHMDARWILFNSLYNSHEKFQPLALNLALLEQGNGTFATMEAQKNFPLPGESEPMPEYGLENTKFMIACNDVAGRFSIDSLDEFRDHVEKFQNASTYIGPIYTLTPNYQCKNLPFIAPKSQNFEGIKGKIETINPILFVNNRLDPVTPHAKMMSSHFKGSRYLHQDTIGHGVIGMRSDCTTKHLTKFMETGELPPQDTLCKPNNKSFDIPLEGA